VLPILASPSSSEAPSSGVGVAIPGNTSPALPIAIAAVVLVVIAGGASYLAYHHRRHRTP